jgi:hypothetical protein
MILISLSLSASFAVWQRTPNSAVPPSDSRASVVKAERNSATGENVPCPRDRNLTEEVKYGPYVLRTYRYPQPEGCLRISKNKKLVFSLDGLDFKIGKNFVGDPGIPIGTDLTGAGKPNAIVSEWSGGAHCCFTIHVFELGDRFQEIARIEAQHSDTAKFVDLNHDGSYEFEGHDFAFAYWRASFLYSPAPRIVLKFRDGKFHLAWDLMRKPEPTPQEFSLLVRSIQSDGEWTDASPTNRDMDCGVPVALWKTMLDLIYTDYPNLAWQLFDLSWKKGRVGKSKFASDFCSQLRGSKYWQDLRPEVGACPPRS